MNPPFVRYGSQVVSFNCSRGAPEHVANEQRLLGELSGKERTELAGLLETLAVSLGDEADARMRGAVPAGRRRRA